MRTSFPRLLPRLAVGALLPVLLAGCAGGQGRDPAPPASPEPVDCRQVACVALTFDDGPGEYTARLLDELEQAGAPATFFVLGRNVRLYPNLVQRMAAQGLQVGSHGYDHRDITTLTREEIEHEVQWTNEAVQEAADVTPRVFRPPYGANGAVYNRLIPTPLVLWNVDTLDWKHHDAKKTVQLAMEEVTPGSIILMHDIHASSVQAVPELVQRLRAAGYTLVTVDGLFAHSEFRAGGVYSKLEAGPTVPAPGEEPG